MKATIEDPAGTNTTDVADPFGIGDAPSLIAPGPELLPFGQDGTVLPGCEPSQVASEAWDAAGALEDKLRDGEDLRHALSEVYFVRERLMEPNAAMMKKLFHIRVKELAAELAQVRKKLLLAVRYVDAM